MSCAVVATGLENLDVLIHCTSIVSDFILFLPWQASLGNGAFSSGVIHSWNFNLTELFPVSGWWGMGGGGGGGDLD